MEFIVVNITTMLRWLLGSSAVKIWRPEKFESLENIDFDHLKHFQNLRHFLMNKSFITTGIVY